MRANDLGFIGCNRNPDPSGGPWTAPPLTDRYWYPFYEKMVELDHGRPGGNIPIPMLTGGLGHKKMKGRLVVE
jgi:hypothetical protein